MKLSKLVNGMGCALVTSWNKYAYVHNYVSFVVVVVIVVVEHVSGCVVSTYTTLLHRLWVVWLYICTHTHILYYGIYIHKLTFSVFCSEKFLSINKSLSATVRIWSIMIL